MELSKDTNIKYQVKLCNEIMLDTLMRLKRSGLDEERIKMLLEVIGKTYCQLGISDKPIDYHIEHVIDVLSK